MVIVHTTVATKADEAGAEVNKAEWNDDHEIGSTSVVPNTDSTTNLGAATLRFATLHVDEILGGIISADDNTITSIGASEIEPGIISGLGILSTPVAADTFMMNDAGSLKEVSMSVLEFTAGQISAPITITESALGALGAAETIDLSTANFFSATLDDDTAITFSNPPASGTFQKFTIHFTQDSTGGFIPTFTDTTSGTPIFNTASGSVTALVAYTFDGGTTYFLFNTAENPLTTKGDLYGFDTANARLAVGTNDHVLTADSAEALGVKWATTLTSFFATGFTYAIDIVAGLGINSTPAASDTIMMLDSGALKEVSMSVMTFTSNQISDLPASSIHNFLSEQHADSVSQAVSNGGLVVGGSSSWDVLAISATGAIPHVSADNALSYLVRGTSDEVLTSTATSVVWSAATGGTTPTKFFDQNNSNFDTSSTVYIDVTNLLLTLPNITGGVYHAQIYILAAAEVTTPVGARNSRYQVLQDDVLVTNSPQADWGFTWQIGTALFIQASSGFAFGDTDGTVLQIQVKVSAGDGCRTYNQSAIGGLAFG